MLQAKASSSCSSRFSSKSELEIGLDLKICHDPVRSIIDFVLSRKETVENSEKYRGEAERGAIGTER